MQGTSNATPDKQERQSVVTNITATNSSVVVGSSDVDIKNASDTSAGDEDHGEMENDLVQVFRGFTMRERVKFMQHTYDYQDACAEDRDKAKKEKAAQNRTVKKEMVG